MPVGVALVGSAETVIAIHGRADKHDPNTIALGGRDNVLSEAIGSALSQAGFDVARAAGDLAGQDRSNIGNRGSSGSGVQLELPRSLRDELIGDPIKLEALGKAIRNALSAASGATEHGQRPRRSGGRCICAVTIVTEAGPGSCDF